jgi:hypothetical protein
MVTSLCYYLALSFQGSSFIAYTTSRLGTIQVGLSAWLADHSGGAGYRSPTHQGRIGTQKPADLVGDCWIGPLKRRRGLAMCT